MALELSTALLVEIAATAANLAFIVLLIRENILCWLFGIVGSLFSVWLFSDARLYSEAVLYFFYAVMGVFLWSGNDPVHFRDLQTSMLSLFRVVTLEDWTDVMYIQMWGSDRYPFSPEDRAAYAGQFDSQASPVIGAVYFVSFVLMGTMIMLNLFIGVIIQSMEEAQDEQAADSREKHMAETGELSVGDELVLLEKELEALQRRVRTLKDRA